MNQWLEIAIASVLISRTTWCNQQTALSLLPGRSTMQGLAWAVRFPSHRNQLLRQKWEESQGIPGLSPFYWVKTHKEASWGHQFCKANINSSVVCVTALVTIYRCLPEFKHAFIFIFPSILFNRGLIQTKMSVVLGVDHSNLPVTLDARELNSSCWNHIFSTINMN